MKLHALSAAALLLATYGIVGCHKKVAAVKPPERTAPVDTASARPAARPAPRQAERAPESTAPAPRRTQPTAAERDQIDQLLSRIQDAYFDYDKHNIRPDAEKALRSDAETLAKIIRQYPEFKLVVEGHCDERGSDEYNLALGEARAAKAKEYLVSLGLPATQLNTISYGRQKPVCTTDDEACWQKNRRAHLAVAAENRAR